MRISVRLCNQITQASSEVGPRLRIKNGTFYKTYPIVGSAPSRNESLLHSNVNFSLEAEKKSSKYWAIVGPSNAGKTTFLEILAGRHICIPPEARSYPSLIYSSGRPDKLFNPAQAIQYVGFDTRGSGLGGPDTKGAYLSARYESRREDTDFSLLDYLMGNLSLNPGAQRHSATYDRDFRQHILSISSKLDLDALLELPVGNLSNGQTRRARIAKALTYKPRLMLLDEPFLGLDPVAKKNLSPLLYLLSRRSGPNLVIALQDTDEIPTWISHVVYIGTDHQIHFQGTKKAASTYLEEHGQQELKTHVSTPRSSRTATQDPTIKVRPIQGGLSHSVPGKSERITRAHRWFITEESSEHLDAMTGPEREPLVELQGVCVRYGGSGGRIVLGAGKQMLDGVQKQGLWWTIRRGERWGVFGSNGSGKTTLLSLISSDHPQSYSLPIRIFGRSRLPTPSQPGISLFDLQARIGQASPEIHNFFPRQLSIRQVIENAWADALLSRPSLTYESDEAVDAALRWFRRELDPSIEGADPLDNLTATYFSEIDNESSGEPSVSTKKIIDNFLETDVDWADKVTFGDVSFSAQRVALFLRAIIKKPDLVVLDEAFSGMDEYTRVKCMMFLAFGETKWIASRSSSPLIQRSARRTLHHKWGKAIITGIEPRQALVNVSHAPDEVPPVVEKWLCLPEGNTEQPIKFGTTPFRAKKGWLDRRWWHQMWFH
ncbi:MAG: hypothetical protein MMC23_007582 [Stictis urceolatum]|nr:hypothetical protein [Stictis urceolata]